jgi:hypothetical protein
MGRIGRRPDQHSVNLKELDHEVTPATAQRRNEKITVFVCAVAPLREKTSPHSAVSKID